MAGSDVLETLEHVLAKFSIVKGLCMGGKRCFSDDVINGLYILVCEVHRNIEEVEQAFRALLEEKKGE